VTVTERRDINDEGLNVSARYITLDLSGLPDEPAQSRLSENQGSGLAARYDYDPWGRRVKTTGSGSVEGDFGFTGHYYHAPSGLHLALYRAYSADLGRWLSRDPIGEPSFEASSDVLPPLWARQKPAELVEGPNLYAYVRNGPVNDGDGLGLKRDCDQEHIQCFRDCWKTKPPWPITKGSSGHYLYCQSKCLAEYMDCEAENAAEVACKFCSEHPYLCAGGIIIILIPKPLPPPLTI
jgi:RHS repeat-associated protein